jgi:hypothetical protein
LPEAPNLVFLTNNCRLPSKISLFFSSIGVINNAAMKKAAVPSILVAVVLLAVAVIAEAQQAKKVARIGYVSSTDDPKTPGPSIEAFQQGLRDLGYIEGKNILVEYRYAEGISNRMPSLVAERCNSRSMWLSQQLYQQSARPSKLPRRFPLSW